MSKLWIVHRNPQSRAALARIAGRDANEIVVGSPSETDFADHPSPAAVLLGVAGDFERELEFVSRLQPRLDGCQWILLAAPEDAAEAARLFELARPEILESLPTARVLRAAIARAFARRHAESLATRRSRKHIADRFSAWLGGIEIPGLLRALDPSLGGLPLLVRGVPGSGRALLARYVELFRTADARSESAQGLATDRATLRIHARDVVDAEDLARRIAERASLRASQATNVWIDEVDALSISAQNALAEWIVHETSLGAPGDPGPHWLATAGPSHWQDPLEPALARAFAPLVIEIPVLIADPDALPTFAREVARDWSRTVGGPERHLSTGALALLSSQTWPGDRAEVEALLRASFASTNHDPVEADDLHLVGPRTPDAAAPESSVPAQPESVDPSSPMALPLVEAIVEAIDEESDGDPNVLPPEFAIMEADDTPNETPQERPDETPPDDSPANGAASAESCFDESVLLSEATLGLAQTGRIESGESLGLGSSMTEATTQGPSASQDDQAWLRLARSLSHEIRNPLVSIRTFAELLPEHYEDETFRERFADLVGRDVAHISDVVSRLQDVAERAEDPATAVDVSALLEELLSERRDRITGQRLLVLRELEREAPTAWAEPTALRIALAGLLDRALDSLPERGDLFVATRHIERAQPADARLRILLRHHNPESQGRGYGHRELGELDELSPMANVIEYVLAETVVRAQGGSLTIDTSDAKETLILLELRTPA